MTEISDTAQQLLVALVEIERHATALARLGGCKCNAPVPDNDRNYPYARFKSAECIGKPFNQIPWEMIHEDGCVMDGQRGIG